MSTDRLAVAAALEEIAGFLEFRGDNPFRVRAFRTAAQAVRGLPDSAAASLESGALAATRGIGPATLAIITELLATGRAEYLEQLRRETPPGLLEMLALPGLGATRIRQLHQGLHLETLDQLEAAARDGRLASLPGFGVKLVERILKGLGFVRRTRPLRLLPQAASEAELLRAALEGLPGVSQALVAGEVRRSCEVVGGLALVVLSEASLAELRGALADAPGIEELVESGPDRLGFRSPGGLPALLQRTTPPRLGAVLADATGSATHLALLAAHAGRAGYLLDSAGLTREGTPIATPDEHALFRTLGLAEIPPELREGGDEIARAATGSLPRLLEAADLRGVLHCHTTYSDGSRSIAEMAAASRAAGYEYLGVTDHSRSAAYAGGMAEPDVRRQWEEIDVLNRDGGIRILKGIEADILADGCLDYDAATLAGFDFVIGSVHSRFGLGRAEMTARVLRALEDPHLTILGHPTGRLLLSRDPYDFDLEQVFLRAAANGVALEINGDPHRLDLDWRLVRRARELGVMIALGADAHAPAELAYMQWSVAMARKAGLTPDAVLNTKPVEQFLAFARARRG